MQCPLAIAADHPAYAGHFPGQPMFPGALLLDEALRVIECARAINITQWQVASVKFLERVRPGDVLTLDHETAANGTIRFAIRAQGRPVATGTLSASHAA